MFDVLVIEDSLTDRMILKMYLEKAGLKVKALSNAESALELMKSSQPLVIITDIILPDMSGFQLCRKLKKNSQLVLNISVIICSSKNTKVDKFWAEMSGADAYFTKPYALEQIVKKVGQLIGLSPQSR
ncbi:MAG: response regulator [Prochloraceae cyanobacterium]|nr:response regulator [Prochloraceae cyanobacterium]